MNEFTIPYALKAHPKHGDFYGYGMVNSLRAKDKVTIICPLHGEYVQRSDSHWGGAGCKECAREKTNTTNTLCVLDVISRATVVHNGWYAYEKFVFINTTTKGIITCRLHGDYSQTMSNHIYGKCGCPDCGKMAVATSQRMSHDEYVERIHSKHGNKYVCVGRYSGMRNDIKIRCLIHDAFNINAANHLNGQGCPKCAKNNPLRPSDEWLHEQYVVGKQTTYQMARKIGVWNTTIGGWLKDANIPINKNHNTSVAEREVREFIVSLGVGIIHNEHYGKINRNIDIMCISHAIGFEYNGLYPHSDGRDNNRDTRYHLILTELCEENNFQLIHIWEDQWRDKRLIVESMIRSRLKKSSYEIFARKCDVVVLNKTTANEFYDKSHIQGGCNASVHLGLFSGEELVACMSFKKVGFLGSKGMDKELIRFCNKLNTNVVGGAGMLLSYYVEKYKPKNIVSYADRCISNGNLYEKLGFRKDAVGKPDYKYTKNGKRFDKVKFTTWKIKKKFPDVVHGTEREMMRSMGYWRIWDCGKIRYLLECE